MKNTKRKHAKPFRKTSLFFFLIYSSWPENILLSLLTVQVGKFLQLISTFLGGFVIAFIKGWLLTLVMLSCIPLLVIAGGAMSLFISKMASRGQSAYAKAANVVEQTIGSIRTVYLFCF